MTEKELFMQHNTKDIKDGAYRNNGKDNYIFRYRWCIKSITA